MLRDTFYTVTNTESTGTDTYKVTATINKDHDIFNGHFPGLPIVPGVCMLQMVKELLEERQGRKLTLKSAGNIKFLTLLNPTNTSQVNIDFSFKQTDDNLIQLDAAISTPEFSIFKIAKALYN